MLPLVPERVVGAAHEHLQSSVGVASHSDVARDYAALRSPVRPAAVRCDLPLVPHGPVGAADKRFQPAIRVLAHRDVGRENAALRSPAGPGFLGFLNRHALGTVWPVPRVDSAFAVGNPEVALLAPCDAPAVLRDPAILTVVVTDEGHAMPADLATGNMAIHAAAVCDEIAVNDEATGDRAARCNPFLDSSARQLIAAADGDVSTLPAGVETGAILVSRDVGIALLQREPLLPARIERGFRPPSVPAIATLASRVTIEQMCLGEIRLETWIAVRHLQRSLEHRDRAECHAGPARALIFYRRYVVLSPNISEIVRRRSTHCRRCREWQLRLTGAQCPVDFLERGRARRRRETQTRFELLVTQRGHAGFAALPRRACFLECCSEFVEIRALNCHINFLHFDWMCEGLRTCDPSSQELSSLGASLVSVGAVPNTKSVLCIDPNRNVAARCTEVPTVAVALHWLASSGSHQACCFS